MAHLVLTFLGDRQILLDSERVRFRSAKILGLLAFLVLEGDHAHDREKLAALLWPDVPDETARLSLRQSLHQLREALNERAHATPFLLVTRQTVQINPETDVRSDVTDLLRAVAHSDWERVAGLYGGSLLPDLHVEESVPFHEWLLVTRERLLRLAIDALHHLTLDAHARGAYPEARRHAERQLALEPWREEAHRELIRLLALMGQRSTALAQYERCVRVLEAELGVEPALETRALVEQIRLNQLVAEAPIQAPPTAPLPTSYFPAEPTPFVGRADELAMLRTQILSSDCRLLTLHGLGGTGKTRLALRLARELAESHCFPDGVHFATLASIASPPTWNREAEEQVEQELVAALAAALHLRGQEQPARAQLLHLLADKELLLVLDNWEHLLPISVIISDLLAHAPSLKVIATSREPLRLHEEWRHRVTGLEVPAEGEDGTESAAVRLFVNRARQVRPTFRLSDRNRAAVLSICRSVEGLPLALELAASWLDSLSSNEIAGEVQRGIDILASDLRNLPPRQQSVRAVFEHSWRLLSPREQQVLARASVFRGGWSQEAAIAVTGATLVDLSALIARSLLSRAPDGRYGLHELLRQFAAEKLDTIEPPRETPTEARTPDRHSHFYLTMLHTHAEVLRGPHPRDITERLRRDVDNLRQAWRWAMSHDRWDWLERGSGALAYFFQHAGLFQEGERTLTAVRERLQARLAAPDAGPGAPLALCETLIVLSDLLAEQAKVREALEAASEAVALARNAANEELEAAARLQMGRTLYRLGEHEQGRVELERAEALARTTHQPRLEADVLTLHGNMALDEGRYIEAREYYQQALALFRAEADRVGEAVALCNLGTTDCLLGDYPEALAYGLEALAIRRAVGDDREIGMSLEALGILYYRMDEVESAQGYLAAALETYRRASALLGVAFALTGLGDTFVSQGELERAAHAYEEALRIRQAANQNYLLPEDWAGLAQVALLRGDLGTAVSWVEAILASLEEQPLKSEDPFRILLICYRVLHTVGDPRAQHVLHLAYARLSQQANAIEAPGSRHAFLHHVTVHRELLAAWESSPLKAGDPATT